MYYIVAAQIKGREEADVENTIRRVLIPNG
jgi:hypothetical protein